MFKAENRILTEVYFMTFYNSTHFSEKGEALLSPLYHCPCHDPTGATISDVTAREIATGKADLKHQSNEHNNLLITQDTHPASISDENFIT